jgi:AcrR family transcriptional regulator
VNLIHNVNVIHAQPPDRPTRRHQQSLDAWLDAGLELVAERGLGGLTIKGLAAQVDRSVGAIYRYFPSKNALIVAMGARVLGDLAERLDAAEGDGPLERALAMVDAYIAFAADEPRRFGLIQQLVGEPRQLLDGDDAQAVADAMRDLLARVALQLELAARTGALGPGDAEARTIQLWAGLHGVLQLRKFGRFDPRMAALSPVARGLAQSLLRGWAAPEPA